MCVWQSPFGRERCTLYSTLPPFTSVKERKRYGGVDAGTRTKVEEVGGNRTFRDTEEEGAASDQSREEKAEATSTKPETPSQNMGP